MPRALPVSATAGGLSAALVSTLFRDPWNPPAVPYLCQDLDPDRIHWPSVLFGVVLGLILGQLLEYCILIRQYLGLHVRYQISAVGNYLAVKSRVGWVAWLTSFVNFSCFVRRLLGWPLEWGLWKIGLRAAHWLLVRLLHWTTPLLGPYPEVPAFPAFSPAQERQIVQSPGSSAAAKGVEPSCETSCAACHSFGAPYVSRCYLWGPHCYLKGGWEEEAVDWFFGPWIRECRELWNSCGRDHLGLSFCRGPICFAPRYRAGCLGWEAQPYGLWVCYLWWNPRWGRWPCGWWTKCWTEDWTAWEKHGWHCGEPEEVSSSSSASCLEENLCKSYTCCRCSSCYQCCHSEGVFSIGASRLATRGHRLGRGAFGSRGGNPRKPDYNGTSRIWQRKSASSPARSHQLRLLEFPLQRCSRRGKAKVRKDNSQEVVEIQEPNRLTSDRH